MAPLVQPAGTMFPLAQKIVATSAAHGHSPGYVQTRWEARFSHDIPHTKVYYAKCAIGGMLSCGLTHFAITPLDVTKCNMQVNPTKYPDFAAGVKTILAEEGAAALWKGWCPTLLGYAAQGAFKFGMYEYFKDFYSDIAGEENAYKYRGLIYLLGSASAEFLADIALCPNEMVKVKTQTSPFGKFPITNMYANMRPLAQTGYPFGSLLPLWGRQIPYTMAKFYFFEKVVEMFYGRIFKKPRETYSKTTQLGITFASGYIAGVVCAIVSHAPDTMVSQLGKAENQGKSMSAIAEEFGYMNLVTKGLGVRIVMIGTLTGLQWWIYDTFKTLNGMGTSGGMKQHKDEH